MKVSILPQKLRAENDVVAVELLPDFSGQKEKGTEFLISSLELNQKYRVTKKLIFAEKGLAKRNENVHFLR